MALPNRLQEVKAIAARYPQAFGPPDETIDARRRPGRLTSDVIIWGP